MDINDGYIIIAGEANAYLNGKVKNEQYYHFGDGNVEITLQGATTE